MKTNFKTNIKYISPPTIHQNKSTCNSLKSTGNKQKKGAWESTTLTEATAHGCLKRN